MNLVLALSMHSLGNDVMSLSISIFVLGFVPLDKCVYLPEDSGLTIESSKVTNKIIFQFSSEF